MFHIENNVSAFSMVIAYTKNILRVKARLQHRTKNTFILHPSRSNEAAVYMFDDVQQKKGKVNGAKKNQQTLTESH